jgi:hypothetical protein
LFIFSVPNFERGEINLLENNGRERKWLIIGVLPIKTAKLVVQVFHSIKET